MGRSEGDFKHLLDTNADQNIGNSANIQPEEGSATIIPQTNPERLLMLTGPSKTGQTTSIVLTAARIVGTDNPNPGYPGPITGVIEFGNGARFTRVEVDIPIGPFVGNFKTAFNATEPQDGGVIVTVPTGVLRVYARYDNQLIQPILAQLFSTATSLAQVSGVSFVGPGGPANEGGTIVPAEPVLVKAMAAYFSRHTSKAYRTHYCYVGDNTSGIRVPISLGGIKPAFFCIPAFARSLKVLRNPSTGGLGNLEVILYDNMAHALDRVAIPSGTAPIIPLVGTETVVQVLSTNPAVDTVNLLALCYEIGI
jgi:hypothetical protein